MIDYTLRTIKWRLTSPYYFLLYKVQRMRRGFSDYDAHSADLYLAGVIANILDHLIKNKMGVPSKFFTSEELADPNIDVDAKAVIRDEEYKHYAALFREYSRHGCAYDQEWKDEFGGLLPNEVDEIMEWLKNNFIDLWT